MQRRVRGRAGVDSDARVEALITAAAARADKRIEDPSSVSTVLERGGWTR